MFGGAFWDMAEEGPAEYRPAVLDMMSSLDWAVLYSKCRCCPKRSNIQKL